MPAMPQKPSSETVSASLGCFLIHGYGGSFFEMEGLAAALAGAGFATHLVCLPGHGEGHENFTDYRFPHWLAHAEKEFRLFAEQYERVAVVGFSMGGTIALNLAARYPVAGIVTISTPLFALGLFPWPLDNLKFHAATLVSQTRQFLGLHKLKVSDTGETSRDIAPWKGFNGPLHWGQLFSIRRGCAATRALVPRVTAPLLALQDARDKLVNPNNVWEIARRASSVDTSVILTRIRENVSRHHMVPTHRETAALAAAAVVRFCREKTLDPVPGPCV